MKKGTCFLFIIIILAAWITSCSYRSAKHESTMIKVHSLAGEVSEMQGKQEDRRQELLTSIKAEDSNMSLEEYEKQNKEMYEKKRQELVLIARLFKTYREDSTKEYKALIDAYLNLFNIDYGLSTLEEAGNTETHEYYQGVDKSSELSMDVFNKQKEFLKSEGVSWMEYVQYNERRNKESEVY